MQYLRNQFEGLNLLKNGSLDQHFRDKQLYCTYNVQREDKMQKNDTWHLSSILPHFS